MSDPQTHWYMRLDTPTFQPAGELNCEERVSAPADVVGEGFRATRRSKQSPQRKNQRVACWREDSEEACSAITAAHPTPMKHLSVTNAEKPSPDPLQMNLCRQRLLRRQGHVKVPQI